MRAPNDLRLIPLARPMRPQESFARGRINPTLRVLPVVLLLYSFLLFPIEVKLVVGGLNFYAFRIAIIVGLPLVIFLSPRVAGKFTMVDALVAVGCSWIVISFVGLYGSKTGIIRSLAVVLDTFGAYVIARGSISNLNDLRRVLILILPGLMFAAAFFAIESLSRQLLIRPLYASLFGDAVNYEAGVARGNLALLYEIRLGLRRAYSVFSFPILGAVILTSLLPLYLMSGIRMRALVIGSIACGAAFFSISSAAFIAIVLALGMVGFDRFLPYLRPLRWPYVAAGLVFYGVLAEIALKGGVVGAIGRFTLNPATAYIRRMQWKYGGETVMENPLFGIGYSIHNKPAWLTDAIDAHFLSLALRNGLMTPVLFAIAVIVLMFSLGRVASYLPQTDRSLVIGLNIMLTILIFSSMTVTFFSEANVFFMIALGVSTSCMVATMQSSGRQIPIISTMVRQTQTQFQLNNR